MKRASGVLLPVFSLPSKYGIGCFSKEAYKFIDQLKEAGQSYWQILPLGPTGYGDSPYQSFSTYAGNPYFIDLKTLIKEGLLTKKECKVYDFGEQADSIDYEKIYNSRFKVLKKAFERFEKDEAYDNFIKENAYWLDDYSLYMAIKDSKGGISWNEWEDALKNREEKALEIANPPPTKEQLVEQAEAIKQHLIAEVTTETEMLRAKLALKRIKPDEEALLIAWMDYLDELEAVDISTAPDIIWPVKPVV